MQKWLIQKWVQNPFKYLRWRFFGKSLLASEANSDSYETSIMELFAKIEIEKLFTIFLKNSILDVWQGSEYTSALAFKVKDV